jgi:hypothetical protein
MATHALPSAQLAPSLTLDEEASSRAQPRAGRATFLRRFYDALIEAQQRRAQHQIDLWCGDRGITPRPPG